MIEKSRVVPDVSPKKGQGLARAVVAHLKTQLRRTTRYDHMRVGILAGFAVLSLWTVFSSCPPPDSHNDLGAVVEILPRSESIMGTQILIWNESASRWTNVTLTLDARWRFTKKVVSSGEKMVLSIDQFHGDDQASPPEQASHSLRIDAREGHATETIENH